jgi:hypothetical protein
MNFPHSTAGGEPSQQRERSRSRSANKTTRQRIPFEAQQRNSSGANNSKLQVAHTTIRTGK